MLSHYKLTKVTLFTCNDVNFVPRLELKETYTVVLSQY